MIEVIKFLAGLGLGGFLGYVIGWWAGWRNGIEDSSYEIPDDKINTLLDGWAEEYDDALEEDEDHDVP
jgi:hypothetical protein